MWQTKNGNQNLPPWLVPNHENLGLGSWTIFRALKNRNVHMRLLKLRNAIGLSVLQQSHCNNPSVVLALSLASSQLNLIKIFHNASTVGVGYSLIMAPEFVRHVISTS